LLDGTKKWIAIWYEEMEAYMVRRNGSLYGTKKWIARMTACKEMTAYMVRRNGLLYGTKKWIARWYEEMDY